MATENGTDNSIKAATPTETIRELSVQQRAEAIKGNFLSGMFWFGGPSEEVPVWFKHFLIHVVKRCAVILVAWIDDVKELSKESGQIEHAGSNGRLNR